jgi:hypothetical protein
MDRQLDYRELAAQLPPGVEPGRTGSSSICRPMIRPPSRADRAAVETIVRDAYSIYVDRIGKPPGPMLDDYAALIDAERSACSKSPMARSPRSSCCCRSPTICCSTISPCARPTGQGFGRRLIAFAEAEARRLGYRELRLYTHEKMTENIALYTRLGFVETGRGHDAGYDRVFMTKRLA